VTAWKAARSLGIVVVVAMLAGCARPNAAGWWDEGTHAVDGYWVTWERPCVPEADEACTVAIETATTILKAKDPGVNITGAVIAGYPIQQGKDSSEVTVLLGGLWKPKFVIFDLDDGWRRTIGLTCGPDFSTGGNRDETLCWESEFEVWRVTGS
jgi:hypothetical protein